MKEILKRFFVVILSPIYFILFLLKKICELGYELGEMIIEPILEWIKERVESMYRFWFGGKGKRCKSGVDVEK